MRARRQPTKPTNRTPRGRAGSQAEPHRAGSSQAEHREGAGSQAEPRRESAGSQAEPRPAVSDSLATTATTRERSGGRSWTGSSHWTQAATSLSGCGRRPLRRMRRRGGWDAKGAAGCGSERGGGCGCGSSWTRRARRCGRGENAHPSGARAAADETIRARPRSRAASPASAQRRAQTSWARSRRGGGK